MKKDEKKVRKRDCDTPLGEIRNKKYSDNIKEEVNTMYAKHKLKEILSVVSNLTKKLSGANWVRLWIYR